METKQSFWTFDNLSAVILSSVLFLLPIFNLPLWGTSLDVNKRFLLILGICLAFILWLLGRLQSGRVVLPKNAILLAAFAVSGVALLSSFFSGSFWNSFSGFGSELDTFLSLAGLTLLMFLFGIYFQTRKKFLSAYLGIFVVALAVFVLELLALLILRTNLITVIQPWTSSFFNGLFSSLVGKWYDLGIYFGFIALSSLIIIELFSLREMNFFRFFIYSCFGVSLLSLAFINYRPIWIILGLFSLLIFVYKISFNKFNKKQPTESASDKDTKIFLPSFFVVLIALLFITLGGPTKFGGMINGWRNDLGVPILEVKPSWSATMSIAGAALWENPVFGVGPNRFVDEWLKHKPVVINSTPYWNVNFRYGVGLLPSFLVTTGVLGALAWLSLLGMVLWYGFRFLFSLEQDKSTRALLALSFFGAVYLWIFSIIYTPDNTIWALTFIITGLFVAILTDTKIVKNIDFSINKDPKTNFLSILAFVVLIIGSITVSYLIIQKYLSIYIYQKGLSAYNSSGDIPQARNLVAQAIDLSNQDTYRRSLSELDIAEFSRLLADKKIPQAELKAQFISLLDSAAKNVREATRINPNNYLNWLARGNVYQAIVPLGIDGSYEEGKKSFTRAQELNPANPSIFLNYFAKLEINNKNIKTAKDYIKQALAIKNDYVAAVALLAQIDASEGNADVAIRRLEEFLTLYPAYVDYNFLFQLGLLKYQKGDYAGAIPVFERSISLLPGFANAKYFLGLSYSAVGKKSEALKHFTDIQKTNPDNQELKKIINNLLTGRSTLPAVETTETKTATSTAKTKK